MYTVSLWAFHWEQGEGQSEETREDCTEVGTRGLVEVERGLVGEGEEELMGLH